MVGCDRRPDRVDVREGRPRRTVDRRRRTVGRWFGVRLKQGGSRYEAVLVSRYLDHPGRYELAHRGGAGLGRENVLETFERSFAAGARYLETDVRITADGVCVAFHDATLTRTIGVKGKVADLSYDQIRCLGHSGASVLRIDDLLDALPTARFAIDLKDARALAPLIGLLRDRGDLDRVALAGARDRWLAAARAMAGNALTTALGWESTTRLVMAARAGRLPRHLGRAEFVHVPHRLAGASVLSDRLIAMAHELGLKVFVWTVDSPSLMRELLDRGVDGIITDRPDLLHEVVHALARNIPAAPDAVTSISLDGQSQLV